jgi:hypothetical protein
MVDKKLIQNALSSAWEIYDNPIWNSENHLNGQSSLTSHIIYDIFGGKILKKRKDKGWHFFNLIGGRYVDFTTPEINKTTDNKLNEILISSPKETDKYFEKEDYFSFYLEFVIAFENLVGLGKQDAEPVKRQNEQIPHNLYNWR